MDKKKQLMEEMKSQWENESKVCVCSWKMFICCDVYKANHQRYKMAKMKESREKNQRAKGKMEELAQEDKEKQEKEKAQKAP